MWIKIIDGERYEFSNDYYECTHKGVKYTSIAPLECVLCGCFIGEYGADEDDDNYIFFIDSAWLNPLGVENYGTNRCPHCGAVYNYIEGNELVLSDDELKMIYDKRKEK